MITSCARRWISGLPRCTESKSSSAALTPAAIELAALPPHDALQHCGGRASRAAAPCEGRLRDLDRHGHGALLELDRHPCHVSSGLSHCCQPCGPAYAWSGLKNTAQSHIAHSSHLLPMLLDVIGPVAQQAGSIHKEVQMLWWTWRLWASSRIWSGALRTVQSDSSQRP